MDSNSSEKLKQRDGIIPAQNTSPIFQISFKKDFSENLVKPGYVILVLITSTVQVLITSTKLQLTLMVQELIFLKF